MSDQEAQGLTSDLLEAMDELFFIFEKEISQSTLPSPLSAGSHQELIHQKIKSQTLSVTENLKETDWNRGLFRLQEIAKHSQDVRLSPWLHLIDHLSEIDLHKMLHQGQFSLMKKESLAAAYDLVLEEMNAKRYSEALEILLTLCFFSPRIYELWIARGLCEIELRKPNYAYSSFTYAAALKPADSTAYWYCAFALQQLSRYPEARDFITAGQQAPIQATSSAIREQVLQSQKG